MDGLGGFFTAFRVAMDVGKKKRPDEEQEGGPYIGGDPSQGRYAMASDPDAPDEPPMSTTGKSYYVDNYLTGETTDPRGDSGPRGGAWGGGRGFGR